MGILYVFFVRYMYVGCTYDLKCLEGTLNILHINIREELKVTKSKASFVNAIICFRDLLTFRVTRLLVTWTLVHRHIFKDYINSKHISVLFVSFERKMHLKKPSE